MRDGGVDLLTLLSATGENLYFLGFRKQEQERSLLEADIETSILAQIFLVGFKPEPSESCVPAAAEGRPSQT